jgi:hypothetical protein
VVQARLKRPLMHAMIDKSKVEMAALQQAGMDYFLCLFHMLQEWERFLRSAEGGVKNDADRRAILGNLQQLARTKDEGAFRTLQKGFQATYVT